MRGPGKLQRAKVDISDCWGGANTMATQEISAATIIVHNHQYTSNNNPCSYFFRINLPQDSCFPEGSGEQGELMEPCILPSHDGNGKFINLMLSFWMGRSVGAVIDYAGGETESSNGQWNEPKELSRDDWTGSLTLLVGQLFHIPHMTHQDQTAALVAK